MTFTNFRFTHSWFGLYTLVRFVFTLRYFDLTVIHLTFGVFLMCAHAFYFRFCTLLLCLCSAFASTHISTFMSSAFVRMRTRLVFAFAIRFQACALIRLYTYFYIDVWRFCTFLYFAFLHLCVLFSHLCNFIHAIVFND